MAPAKPHAQLWRRLLWFAGLWALGVVAAVTAACLIRAWLTQ